MIAATASAVVTAHFALVTTEGDMERLLIESERDDAEVTAALLSTKVDMLRDAHKAVMRQAPVELWDDPPAMRRYLAANSGIGSLFENVMSARPSGKLLTRLSIGQISPDLPNIADRAYFRDALHNH